MRTLSPPFSRTSPAPSAPRRPCRNRAAVARRRWHTTLALGFLIGGTSLALPSRTAAADGPTLLKRTVMVQLRRFARYWPNPKAKEPQYNTYCWVPKVQFEVLGPVPGGSQFIAVFSKPNGSPWLTVNLPTEEIAEGDSAVIKMPDMDENVAEKKAITATGTFPFEIRLKNELAGKNEVFFKGKYEVTKFPLPRVPASEKNKMDFSTVEDWRPPIGFIWLNPRVDENVPALSVQMWFRGASTEMQALLFQDGKQVGDTRGENEQTLPTPGSESAFNWELWKFTFLKVRGFNQDPSSANSYPETHFLDKNPGNYEIKVLREGKLARSAKFTVGADGKIVDNGIATQNKLGGIRMVLPVTVHGDADGKLKADAWKTHAFYGNPLTGFDPAVSDAAAAASAAPATE